MKDKMVLELLIRAIIYGRIRYDHPYLLEASNLPTIRKIIESIVKLNLKYQNYFPDEKDNLLAVIGLYRFDYPFASKEEESEMKDWCNRMIEGLNHADSVFGVPNKIGLYEAHGFEFDEDEIDEQNYARISRQVGVMSELEFHLVDYLKSDEVTHANSLKRFMLEPSIESCIYYLLQVCGEKFSSEELVTFLTIEQGRKILSSIELNNSQYFILKESTQNKTIGKFTNEEIQYIRQFVDFNFSDFLEDVIQNRLSNLDTKIKKKHN